MLKSVNDAPAEIADPIREFWPPEQWDNAASVAFLESGWKWDAEVDTTDGGNRPCGEIIASRGGIAVSSEHSIGYFQINVCNFPGWNPGHFFNARQNAGTAHELWVANGWRPWFFSAQQLGLLD